MASDFINVLLVCNSSLLYCFLNGFVEVTCQISLLGTFVLILTIFVSDPEVFTYLF